MIRHLRFYTLVVLLFLLIFCLWTHSIDSAIYVGLVLAIAVLLTTLILSGDRLSVLGLFGTFLLTRNIFYLASNYKTLPFIDPWWSYGTAKSISVTGALPVFTPGQSFITTQLSWPSGWPLLPIDCSMLSNICGFDTFTSTLVLTQILSVVIFAGIYLLFSKLSGALGLDKRLPLLALLVYIFTPEPLFWFGMFKYEVLAIALMISFFIILFKYVNSTVTTVHDVILSIVFFLGIVLSHHFVSLIVAFYLIGLYIVYVILRIVQNVFVKQPVYNFAGRNVLLLGLAVVTMIFIWWTNYATTVLTAAGAIAGRLIELFRDIWSMSSAIQVSGWYPSVLTPTWTLNLLFVRDLLLYGSMVIGFVFLLKNFRKNSFYTFISASVLIFGALASINLITADVGFTRIIPYAMPFFAFSGGVFLIIALNAKFTEFSLTKRKIFKFVVCFCISLSCITIITGYFIGLSGSRSPHTLAIALLNGQVSVNMS